MNENQTDTTVIALGIYLKLSNKRTKESALQDWFFAKTMDNGRPDTIQY